MCRHGHRGGVRLPAGGHPPVGALRRDDAIAPTEEAVATYRDLAATNRTYLNDLASALNSLGNHYRELGDPGGDIEQWELAVAALPTDLAIWLRARRARRFAADHPPMAISDLLAIAEHRPASGRGLSALGEARRIAAGVAADLVGRPDIDPKYQPLDPTVVEALEGWLSTAGTEREPEALRVVVEALGSEASAALDRWRFLHPEIKAGQRGAAVLAAVAEHGLDAVTAELEATAAQQQRIQDLLTAIASSDPEQVRAVLQGIGPDAADLLSGLAAAQGDGARALRSVLAATWATTWTWRSTRCRTRTPRST